MAKTYSWSTDTQEMRRLFTLTYHDLQFLEPLRADAQRLYRALVLAWARVERMLVSDPSDIPEDVIEQVSEQLSLKPSALSQLRNHPSARSATFEAVRKHLEVRASLFPIPSSYRRISSRKSRTPAILQPSLMRPLIGWCVSGYCVHRGRRPLTVSSIRFAIKLKTPSLNRSPRSSLRRIEASSIPSWTRQPVIVAWLGWALHREQLLSQQSKKSVSA